MSKITLSDAFGKTHEFDYDNSFKYAYDLYSKNSRVVIFIESKIELQEELPQLVGSIDNILKTEYPRISQYIPSGWKIDIYKPRDEEKENKNE